MNEIDECVDLVHVETTRDFVPPVLPVSSEPLGLAALRREAWVDGPGRAATLEVEVWEPVVKHTVSVQQVERWLDGLTTSPNERVKKERLKALLR